MTGERDDVDDDDDHLLDPATRYLLPLRRSPTQK
jgi:hypothetical protein